MTRASPSPSPLHRRLNSLLKQATEELESERQRADRSSAESRAFQRQADEAAQALDEAQRRIADLEERCGVPDPAAHPVSCSRHIRARPLLLSSRRAAGFSHPWFLTAVRARGWRNAGSRTPAAGWAPCARATTRTRTKS